MMRILSEIVKRMGETPAKAEELVLKRGEAADALHNGLDESKRIEIQVAGQVAAERNREGKPVYANAAMREFEEVRRLAAHGRYQELQGKIEAHRNALRALDAALESLRLRAKADEQVVALVTALLNTGHAEDAENVLTAYAGVTASDEAQKDEAPAPAADASPATPAGTAANPGGLETLRATVLEVRAGKSAGTIRAFCELDDGGKIAVYGKNGVGQTLAGAVGREVEVKGRHGDKGFIALDARVA
ncbi:MAG: hypothetical protein QMC81_10580 [Thermoanaerobacterales bacterium]|nr:hypothetical protein [Thermoanaerobacterales bacterium]